MSTWMTLSDPDWGSEGSAALWAEDERTADPRVAAICADSQQAWLINNAGRMGAGWRFAGDTFEGPAYREALVNAERLIGESIDQVCEWIDNGEIFEELADDGG